ncbi:NAC domain-containing protein 35 [Linum grandiflorum]
MSNESGSLSSAAGDQASNDNNNNNNNSSGSCRELLPSEEGNQEDEHEHDMVMPGFRFHPTEEELVEFYLRRKVEGKRFNVELITFLDLYRYDPWELPAMAAIGEKEWFFYVPRDRKYRNGDRPNRVTTSGYWKATGADRMIRTENSRSIGLKKTLVFYSGKAPKGIRSSWIMNEYRLPHVDTQRYQKTEISLCRVYKRAGVEDHHGGPSSSSSSSLPRSLPSSIRPRHQTHMAASSSKKHHHQQQQHHLQPSAQHQHHQPFSTQVMNGLVSNQLATSLGLPTLLTHQQQQPDGPQEEQFLLSSNNNNNNTTLIPADDLDRLVNYQQQQQYYTRLLQHQHLEQNDDHTGQLQHMMIFPPPSPQQNHQTVVPTTRSSSLNVWDWNILPPPPPQHHDQQSDDQQDHPRPHYDTNHDINPFK